MSSVRRFEDLACWQQARELTNFIYNLTLKPEFKRDHGLANQIQRASVSVMSNISEGFERGTTPDFIHFLYIAKGSAGEVRNQLYVARDLRYINDDELNKGLNLAKRVAGTIFNFIDSLKVSKFKGQRFATKEMMDARKQKEEYLKELKKQYPNFNF